MNLPTYHANRARLALCMGTIGLLAGVWSSSAAQKPFYSLPATGEPLPASAAEFKIENIVGGSSALADYRGRVVLLLVAAKDSSAAAGKVTSDLGVSLAGESDLTRITIAD